MNCIKCGGQNVIKEGKSKDGLRQRWFCKDCKRRFTEGTGYIHFSETDSSLVCPNCGSKHLKRKGYTKANNQMYYCNDCHKKFVPGGRKPAKQITEQDKKLILYFRNARVSINDLSKHFCYSVRTIAKFLKEQGISTNNLYRLKKNPEQKMKRGKFTGVQNG